VVRDSETGTSYPLSKESAMNQGQPSIATMNAA
jgi:hypothetical protein